MSNYNYNKGEWAELYTFLYALDKGEIHSADEHMIKEEQTKYNVVSVFQKDNEYVRDTENNQIIHQYEEEEYTYPIKEISSLNNELFDSIKNSTGRSFPIPLTDEILDKLHITSLKAGSNLKGDLNLKVHDTYTNTDQLLSFSVKSYIGGNPTLLNSSTQTTIVFELSKNLTEEQIKEVNAVTSSNKIQARINAIVAAGSSLKYYDCPSPTFKRNLQMIDYRLPEILSELYLESYFVRGRKISNVIEQYISKKPNEDKELFSYKITQLLIASALGMVPDTLWHGIDEATGGYIVVKNDGEVLCYHLYERNKLSKYLFNHTSFDTPSSSRYGTGTIYLDPETQKQMFKLNIQIRFYN